MCILYDPHISSGQSIKRIISFYGWRSKRFIFLMFQLWWVATLDPFYVYHSLHFSTSTAPPGDPVGVKAANLRLMGASECHRPVDNHPHLVSHLSALKHMLALFHDLLVVTDSYSSLPLTLLSCSHGSNSPLLELWLCALTAQPPGYINLGSLLPQCQSCPVQLGLPAGDGQKI